MSDRLLRLKVSFLRQPILLTSVVITGLLLGIKQLGWLQLPELFFYDRGITLQPQQSPDHRLLIVGITDADIQAQQQWPLSDHVLAQTLQRLQEHQPKAIGIDLYRDVPHPPGQDDLQVQLAAENVFVIEAYDAVAPPPGVPRERVGFNDVVIDADGIVRRHLMFTTNDEEAFYSFGLRVSLHYVADHALSLKATPEYLQIGPTLFRPLKPNSGGYQSVDTTGYQTLLRYRAAQPVARQVTLTQLLQGEIEADWVKDKVVLIGTTTPSEQDTFFTPLTGANQRQASLPGVELHAQMISQILTTVLDRNSHLFWFWSDPAEGIWIWVWSLIGGVVVWYIKRPLALGFAGAGGILGLMGIHTVLLWQGGWIPVVAPIIGCMATGVGVLAHKRFYQLWHDPLTQLANYERFIVALKRTLSPTHPTQPIRLAVLSLKLNRLGLIYSSVGHKAGHQALQAIVKRWKKGLRNGEYIARIADETFAVLVRDITDVQDAICVAARLQDLLEQPIEVLGQSFYPTLSIGIALNQPDVRYLPDQLINDANAAMYCAQTRGQGYYSVFAEGMREQVIHDAALETELRQALVQQEFQLCFQPIVSLKTGQISGFEALLYWLHPQRGFIAPGDFIAVAEQTGLILPLGEWVFKTACEQMKAWAYQGCDLNTLTMNVNLSIQQLAQSNLVEQFAHILEETKVPGHQLKLELTESVMMENITDVLPILLGLRALGLQLSIDDFGTGYSSLCYLPRLPVDTLKIDRSFVSRMNESHEDAEIVKMIVTLSHQLNLDVVAEGIETIDQMQQLQALNCDYAQGYFFSKPVPSDAATVLLTHSKGLIIPADPTNKRCPPT